MHDLSLRRIAERRIGKTLKDPSSAPTILDVRTFDTNSTVMPSDRDRLALPNFDYASVAVAGASISGAIAGVPLADSVDVHP
jgi:hypothetical protein